MARLLRLLELHQEALVFRCVRVGVDHSRRQEVDAVARRGSLVFGDAAVAPMNRDADLVSLLAVDQHRLGALRHHRFGDVRRARARHFTWSPPLIPRSFASSCGISTNGSGTSWTFIGLF